MQVVFACAPAVSTSATRFLPAVVPILCALNAAAAGATCADFISRRRWVKLFAMAAKLLAEAEACKRASRRTFHLKGPDRFDLVWSSALCMAKPVCSVYSSSVSCNITVFD